VRARRRNPGRCERASHTHTRRRREALRALLAADGLYRVRAPADALSPDAAAEAGRYVSTFLPLRCLVLASLAENFVLHVDEAGRVYALEWTPPGGACAPASAAQAAPPPPPPRAWAFRSTASVKLPKEAPPLASTAAQRFDADGADAAAEAAEGTPRALRCSACALRCSAARAHTPHCLTLRPRVRRAAPGAAADVLAEKPPERSFLSKYGMVIAMLAFNLVFRGAGGGAAAPAEGAAAEGAAGGAAGGAAKPAAGAKRD
jgi:hypothetical protein